MMPDDVSTLLFYLIFGMYGGIFFCVFVYGEALVKDACYYVLPLIGVLWIIATITSYHNGDEPFVIAVDIFNATVTFWQWWNNDDYRRRRRRMRRTLGRRVRMLSNGRLKVSPT